MLMRITVFWFCYRYWVVLSPELLVLAEFWAHPLVALLVCLSQVNKSEQVCGILWTSRWFVSIWIWRQLLTYSAYLFINWFLLRPNEVPFSPFSLQVMSYVSGKLFQVFFFNLWYFVVGSIFHRDILLTLFIRAIAEVLDLSCFFSVARLFISGVNLGLPALALTFTFIFSIPSSNAVMTLSSDPYTKKSLNLAALMISRYWEFDLVWTYKRTN